jgi:hypothetical protein
MNKLIIASLILGFSISATYADTTEVQDGSDKKVAQTADTTKVALKTEDVTELKSTDSVVTAKGEKSYAKKDLKGLSYVSDFPIGAF